MIEVRDLVGVGDIAADVPEEIRQALMCGPRVWMGQKDHIWLGRCVAWERLEDLARHFWETTGGADYQKDPRDRSSSGFVYAVHFPGVRAVKFGMCTRKPWERIRLFRIQAHSPELDCGVLESCQVVALVPCEGVKWAENSLIASPREINLRWHTRHPGETAPWVGDGRTRDTSHRVESFHESPGVSLMAAMLSYAMRAAIAYRTRLPSPRDGTAEAFFRAVARMGSGSSEEMDAELDFLAHALASHGTM